MVVHKDLPVSVFMTWGSSMPMPTLPCVPEKGVHRSDLASLAHGEAAQPAGLRHGSPY